MEQEVYRHRNAVFNRIYHSSLTLYRTCIPPPLRWFLEIYFLFLALAVLLLWGYVHFTYIVNSEDCLVNVTDHPFPRDVILQVEVYSNTSEIWNQREKVLLHRYKNKYRRRDLDKDSRDFVKEYCESNMIVNLTGTNYFCQLLLAELIEFTEDEFADNEESLDLDDLIGRSAEGSCAKKLWTNDWVDKRVGYCSIIKPSRGGTVRSGVEEDITAAGLNYTLLDLFDSYSLRVLVMDYVILEFSQEPGYLSLSHQSRSKLNISVVKVYIDPDEATCFGGYFGRFMTKYFLGYDMMVISSLKGLLASDRASGYVKNCLTGSLYYYKVQWMGKWRYGAGILPALFFTLVATVLLRRIHYHVFKFLTHFHHLLNQGVPMPIQTGAQIPFLIVTYATIGLVIVMSEALSDDSVFSLLMVGTVWEVDQFYSIYCKQDTSKNYLPWFFFLYHFLPYAYYIRFNGQFWFIPFLFHWLLLQHVMLFFLHHCELPALDRANRVDFVDIHRPPPIIPPPPPLVPNREPLGRNELHDEELARHEVHQEETEVVGVDQHVHDDQVEVDRVMDTSGEVLMRSQLHSTTHMDNDSPIAIQDSGSQLGEQPQLTDEELRKIRLQHFEKK